METSEVLKKLREIVNAEDIEMWNADDFLMEINDLISEIEGGDNA